VPRSSAPPPRIGLVLGAGGAVGAAFHAGALAAIENDLGWDPRTADVIVGTSAGSLVGALLRVGVPASDLAALFVGAEARLTDRALADRLSDRPVFAPFTLRHLLGIPRIPTPALVTGIGMRTLRRGSAALGGWLAVARDGREELSPHLDFLDDAVGDRPWPDDDLWITATRQSDGRRVVFGREGSPAASLVDAVAASCAVPGYFRPVTVDGRRYVDGGLVSATNAGVLRRRELDAVVVVSPMTGDGDSGFLSRQVRSFCARTLGHEVRALERAGVPTLVLEPGEETFRHAAHVLAFMDDDAARAAVLDAFLDSGSRLSSDPALRDLVRSANGPAEGHAA
jgi:NTE family protein